ncbi:MAG: hypothetical protein KF878_12770 [Planctomycetes bacterium]|nr:hypothetical protein [Planctomycetota bacterium]
MIDESNELTLMRDIQVERPAGGQRTAHRQRHAGRVAGLAGDHQVALNPHERTPGSLRGLDDLRLPFEVGASRLERGDPGRQVLDDLTELDDSVDEGPVRHGESSRLIVVARNLRAPQI